MWNHNVFFSSDLEHEESHTEASKESSHLKSKKRNNRSKAKHTTCSNKKGNYAFYVLSDTIKILNYF